MWRTSNPARSFENRQDKKNSETRRIPKIELQALRTTLTLHGEVISSQVQRQPRATSRTRTQLSAPHEASWTVRPAGLAPLHRNLLTAETWQRRGSMRTAGKADAEASAPASRQSSISPLSKPMARIPAVHERAVTPELKGGRVITGETEALARAQNLTVLSLEPVANCWLHLGFQAHAQIILLWASCRATSRKITSSPGEKVGEKIPHIGAREMRGGG